MSAALGVGLWIAGCAAGPGPEEPPAPGAPEGAREAPREAAGETAAPPSAEPDNAITGKISSHLLKARDRARQGLSPEEIEFGGSVVRFENGRALVDVRLRRLDHGVLVRLLEAGLEIVAAHTAYARIDGSCELESLAAIAAMPEVTAIHPQYGATTR